MDEVIKHELDRIERERAAMKPEDRAELERREIDAQRESWVRAMGPCEHGVLDFEDCVDCRAERLDRIEKLEAALEDLISAAEAANSESGFVDSYSIQCARATLSDNRGVTK